MENIMRKTISRMYMEESYFVPTDNHENVTLQKYHTWGRSKNEGVKWTNVVMLFMLPFC